MNDFFEKIGRDGFIKKDDHVHAYAEKEMIRSHGLSIKISLMRPSDPGYKELLEELLQDKIDGSVAIVSPFYCDFGSGLKLGKNIVINKGATFFSAGIVEIADGVMIGPDVKIITVNHDFVDRHNKILFKKVTVKKNAWIAAGAIICPGVTVGENSVVAAGAVVTKDVAANTVVGGNPARFIKNVPLTTEDDPGK